jgi:hypothetical protein
VQTNYEQSFQTTLNNCLCCCLRRFQPMLFSASLFSLSSQTTLLSEARHKLSPRSPIEAIYQMGRQLFVKNVLSFFPLVVEQWLFSACSFPLHFQFTLHFLVSQLPCFNPPLRMRQGYQIIIILIIQFCFSVTANLISKERSGLAQNGIQKAQNSDHIRAHN